MRNAFRLAVPLLALLALALVLPAAARENDGAGAELVTVYLVRHAEADTHDHSNQDPPLTDAGIRRAERLAAMLSAVTLDAALSTPLQRTLSTAQPVIEGRGLTTQTYGPREIGVLANRIAKGELGGTVFVAGHSNTTPDFVEALGGPETPDLNHDEYDALFIVTIAVVDGEPAATSVQKLHY